MDYLVEERAWNHLRQTLGEPGDIRLLQGLFGGQILDQSRQRVCLRLLRSGALLPWGGCRRLVRFVADSLREDVQLVLFELKANLNRPQPLDRRTGHQETPGSDARLLVSLEAQQPSHSARKTAQPKDLGAATDPEGQKRRS